MKSFSARELAAFVGGELTGDADVEITGIAPIDAAREGQLTFIAQPQYDHFLAQTPAAAVLVRPGAPAVKNKNLIRVENPYLAFVNIARELFRIGAPRRAGIHATALVDPSAEIGADVSAGAFAIIGARARLGDETVIGAHTVVGEGSVLGRRCIIGRHVTLEWRVQLGDEVIVQSGSVVGSDGFGYVKDGDVSLRIPHVGTVVLEDRVEIGANCTIDRATFGETRVKAGAKLDNLIHVAHNVEIGENTVIAAQTGISGSTKIGRNVIIAGQVGFVGHITIGDRSVFGAQAGVTKSIPEGLVVSGYPAKNHMQARREEAAVRRAPEMLKRLKKLEGKVAAIRPQQPPKA